MLTKERSQLDHQIPICFGVVLIRRMGTQRAPATGLKHRKDITRDMLASSMEVKVGSGGGCNLSYQKPSTHL